MAKRTLKGGFETLSRKTRQVINKQTGEVLSERQYRKRFTGKTNEQVQKERGAPLANYNRLIRARQRHLKSRGVTMNLREVRQSADMQRVVKTLKHHTREVRHTMRALDKENADRARRGLRPKHLTAEQKRRLFGPDSELAQALVDVGYRDADARHYVGDS